MVIFLNYGGMAPMVKDLMARSRFMILTGSRIPFSNGNRILSSLAISVRVRAGAATKRDSLTKRIGTCLTPRDFQEALVLHHRTRLTGEMSMAKTGYLQQWMYHSDRAGSTILKKMRR